MKEKTYTEVIIFLISVFLIYLSFIPRDFMGYYILSDKAMSDMEIYSVEPCNIRRGAPCDVLLVAEYKGMPAY